MRKWFLVGTLATLVGLYVGCFSDGDSSSGQPNGSTGSGGASGSAGGGAGLGGAGNGGGGAAGGPEAGTIGGGGAGGTTVDSCQGVYAPLPFAVSSAFTTLRICSEGACGTAPMPYFFNPVANPNCDEVFPDGGIEPPFAEAGVDDAAGTDAGSVAVDATATGGDAAASDSGAVADVKTDAPPPPCYEFLYNPACTTTACWGGVIFTQSAGGMFDPGVCIQPGATRITFQAKASRPDARIKFGSIREGMGTTEFYLFVTTDWASYEVTIPPDEPYNVYSLGATGVWNGFSMILEPADHPGGTYIFVKDVVWMK